jgi:hypothetical protein
MKWFPIMKPLFFALLAIASFSAESLGQTIINQLFYTITAPGTYVVGSDLVFPTNSTGTAIMILASNVTLDLGGHSTSYSGARARATVSSCSMLAMSLSRTAP